MKLESFSLLLLLFLLHHARSSPLDVYPVKDICKRTSYPDHCESSLKSMVPDLTKADPTTILHLFMKAAEVNTEAALLHAKEILNGSRTNESEKAILKACIESYDSAGNVLGEAESALERHDHDTMTSHISAVITFSEDCEEAYQTGKLESPLSGYATMNVQFAANSLKLIESFWWSMPPVQPPSLSTIAPQSVEIEEEYSVTADDYNELLDPPAAPPSSSSNDSSNINEAKSICDKAKYPDVCMSSVQSVASGPLKSADAATVLQLMIKDTIFTTQSAIDKAKVFAKASETDQRTKGILVYCTNEYEHALNDLGTATKAIASNDKATLESILTGVINQYSMCGDAFEGAQLDSPMEEYEDTLNQLAENNLAVFTSFW